MGSRGIYNHEQGGGRVGSPFGCSTTATRTTPARKSQMTKIVGWHRKYHVSDRDMMEFPVTATPSWSR